MQEKNNDYRQGWAQAALTAGSDDAKRRMLSNQWDLDYYSKAHGAREKMADQRRADALTFFQSYLKGVNDIGMFNKQMDLYWADYYAKHPEKDPNNKVVGTPDYSHYDNKSKYDATNIGETSYQYNPSVVPSSENIGQWIQSLINPQVQNKPKVEKKERLQTSSNGGSQYMFNPMIPSYDSADSSKNTGKTQINNTNNTYVSPYATV
jgi:hypothetical protein